MKKRTKKIIFGVVTGLALALSIGFVFALLEGHTLAGIVLRTAAGILSCVSVLLFLGICKDLKEIDKMQSGPSCRPQKRKKPAPLPFFCHDCEYWHRCHNEPEDGIGICDASVHFCDAWNRCDCGEYKEKQPGKEQKKQPTIPEAVQVVYIAGKMSGLPDLGRAAFMKAERDVAGLGFIPLNPARLPDNLPKSSYLPICMAMLEQADGIYMLQGWEDSPGARIELAFAKYQNKAEIYEEDFA